MPNSRALSCALPRAAALAVLAGWVSACGGPAPPPCTIPPDAAAAALALDGVWSVMTHEGELDGLVVLEPERVSASSGDTTFFGTWRLVSSDENVHALELAIDEAQVGDVRQLYGDETILTVDLLFAGPDVLFAMQPDGLWTRWERRAVPAAPTAEAWPGEGSGSDR